MVCQALNAKLVVINPVLRGWVTYFAVGHSSRCFSYVRDWVEKKVRRHLMRARKRRGFRWKRWSIASRTHRGVPAVQEMKVGPSEPLYRRRLQTTLSCCSQKLWW